MLIFDWQMRIQAGDNMSIEKLVPLVTGASRGLGSELVRSFIQRGVEKVYVTARNPFMLDVPAASGTRVQLFAMDITNEKSVRQVVEHADDVNVLINNAGTMQPGKALESPVGAERSDMETNYFGTLNVVRAFWPVLAKNRPAKILNILSISALASSPAAAAYSASKAATFSLTQALRTELADSGITVSGAFPGPVDTEMTAGLEMTKASPRDTAEAILEGFLNGDEDIFPDNMARQVGAMWQKNPKILEKQLAMI